MTTLDSLKIKLFSSPVGIILKKGLLPFIPAPSGATYVFVLGCYNSGTTLLDNILGAHSEISNLPTEGVALSYQYTGPEHYSWPRLWHKCEHIMNSKDIIDSELLKKEWGLFFKKDKNFFLEKSIVNSTRIPWLNEKFNNPYFIWIIRNGYAVSEGIRRRSQKSRFINSKFKAKGYPIEWCAKQWVMNNQKIAEDVKKVKRFKVISYENLTDNMEQTIEALINWLPVKNKQIPQVDSFLFHGIKRKIENMNKQSVRKLSKDDIEKINLVAKDSLSHWGYPAIDGGA
jgi:Sulfotransferase family